MMTKAILLHDQEEPIGSLKRALERQPVQTIRVRACADALRMLDEDDAPCLVFTDLTVSDGSWADALRLTYQATRPLNLLVVSRLADVPLYIAAMESGAFDFMVPPFEDADVAFVLRHALDDVARRSGAPKSLAASAGWRSGIDASPT